MFKEVDYAALELNPMKFWQDWLLLCVGDYHQRQFNSMTIAMGSLGVMWHIPIIIIGVRPTRYSYEFIETYDDFSVNKLPSRYKDDLKVLGTKSGRDIDKRDYEGLHPIPGIKTNAPIYREAEMVFECRKIYWDDIDKISAKEPILDFYKDREYHRLYIGRIEGIYVNTLDGAL
jgi:flavin reductase (DIM6/NTAB) family NADH-FMN oxidoreductase RutF